MSTTPILQNHFYHDGRGPELQKVVWSPDGFGLLGFEYFNPDDEYVSNNLKHIRLGCVQVYSMAGEEVHGNLVVYGNSSASIVKVENSTWKATFDQKHLKNCHHYQFMFYDQIFDVICQDVIFGYGTLDV